MITVTPKGLPQVQAMLDSVPKQAQRAAELALDQTARDIRKEVREVMPKVFDRPTRYTLNSLQVSLTQNHVLEASVWFKEPDRMGAHYLVPQVEGTVRTHRGFERALGRTYFYPGKGAELDRYGNVSAGKIRQILSVLGRAERAVGDSANITGRSRRRNSKVRDYVWITRRHGKLPPGVYERYVTGQALTRSQRRKVADKSRAYQVGQRGTATRARGLRAIFIEDRQRRTRPQLPFYDIASRAADKRFELLFWRHFDRLIGVAQ